ncbi:MAG: tetratricopeptide repeat protein [Bacteroidales bacterium]|nr:tetratricopeptide repeat protein [Bacteroidales bacterium]
MKKIFLLFLLALISLVPLYAQKKNANTTNNNSYNVTRGFELWKQGNFSESKTYFLKELEDNPSNTLALLSLGYIARYEEKYGEAIAYYTSALKVCPQKRQRHPSIRLYGNG